MRRKLICSSRVLLSIMAFSMHSCREVVRSSSTSGSCGFFLKNFVERRFVDEGFVDLMSLDS